MNAAGRLAAYAAGLVVVFGGSYAVASAVVPADAVAQWREDATAARHDPAAHDPAAGHPAEDTATASTDEPGLAGLSLAADGHVLSPVRAPGAVGQRGTLSFQVLGPAGTPVTDYAIAHEEDLHLIVVRSDGAGFRHVHPTLDPATGTWSIPWTWEAAGTHRVFADFTPAGAAGGLTLTRTVQVAGNVTPSSPPLSAVSEVDGFTVTATGDLTAGRSGELDLTVTREGEPVTTLEPYLGAYGHLVALREGDLAYLHVHAEGEAPAAGRTAGPTTTFAVQVPTAGRYLLYLDFQVEGRVRTASFVLEAAAAGSTTDAAGAPTTGGPETSAPPTGAPGTHADGSGDAHAH